MPVHVFRSLRDVPTPGNDHHNELLFLCAMFSGLWAGRVRWLYVVCDMRYALRALFVCAVCGVCVPAPALRNYVSSEEQVRERCDDFGWVGFKHMLSTARLPSEWLHKPPMGSEEVVNKPSFK